MTPAKLIGLTGNIATGKSHVARVLRSLGAQVIDADAIARQVVEKGRPALAEIARVFGPSVLTEAGELNRRALGAIVFSDPARLRQLEAITHPAVHAEIERLLAAMPSDAIAVIEVIKLFEAGWAERCDQVWVTTCSTEEQIRRLIASRGLSEAEARARVEAQNPQEDKIARADVVIDTSGSPEQTEAQVHRAWNALLDRSTKE
ncbi:MAG: dephospho-CoA kinase [Anaerolineae bacterium]|nr:dephospho-CoA kinase [Thermoflexales bacterium]MDW8407701.1 dephospho-CoA kinase [Anaerolineae bacterium]